MFAKILLASDGSAGALKAAEAAAALAKRFDASVTILHVFTITPSIAVFYGVPGIGMTPAALSLMEADVHKDVLGRTGAVLEREGVAYTTRQEEGHAAEIILAVAEEGSYNLVVLGSHGLSGFRSFLLGSVPDRVSHHARCDVLIIK